MRATDDCAVQEPVRGSLRREKPQAHDARRLMSRVDVKKVRKFLQSVDGPTTIEYALLLSLIAAVCVGSVRLMSQSTANSFDNSSQAIGNAFGGS
jgi:Flp pilus assembly pilin Flp